MTKSMKIGTLKSLYHNHQQTLFFSSVTLFGASMRRECDHASCRRLTAVRTKNDGLISTLYRACRCSSKPRLVGTNPCNIPCSWGKETTDGIHSPGGAKKGRQAPYRATPGAHIACQCIAAHLCHRRHHRLKPCHEQGMSPDWTRQRGHAPRSVGHG